MDGQGVEEDIRARATQFPCKERVTDELRIRAVAAYSEVTIHSVTPMSRSRRPGRVPRAIMPDPQFLCGERLTQTVQFGHWQPDEQIGRPRIAFFSWLDRSAIVSCVEYLEFQNLNLPFWSPVLHFLTKL